MENQIWVTNETTPLSREIYSHFGGDIVVNYDSELDFFRTQKSLITDENEINIFDPTLIKLVNQFETDFIIHSFPMTYEQAVDEPLEAIHNNLEGAHRIAEVAKKSKVKLIHINYPLYKNINTYTDNIIYFCNESVKKIYDMVGVGYVVLNPPILYSEKPHNIIYDLVKNSNISKFYVDPERRKPFMHAKDFARVIEHTIFNFIEMNKDWFDVPPTEVFTFEDLINEIEVEFNFYEQKDYYYFETINKLDSSSIFNMRFNYTLKDTIKNIKSGK